ncbi:hypothetical protein GCM10009665_25990 [Kitasatospora nipponensis]|uniref:Ricin B lectin domain-containing protein n=1 Tax=Kitasatospora nipponensis TaxID=258049 RepID=A0ABN1W4S9_9ACTN
MARSEWVSRGRRCLQGSLAVAGIAAVLATAMPAVPASAATLDSNPHHLFNGYTGLCIDTNGGGLGLGVSLNSWNCNTRDSGQYWTISNPTGKGTGTISPKDDSRLCLDTNGGSLSAGAQLDLWKCDDSQAEQWQYVNGQLKQPLTNMCADLDHQSGAPGATVELWDCSEPTATWSQFDFPVF